MRGPGNLWTLAGWLSRTLPWASNAFILQFSFSLIGRGDRSYRYNHLLNVPLNSWNHHTSLQESQKWWRVPDGCGLQSQRVSPLHLGVRPGGPQRKGVRKAFLYSEQRPAHRWPGCPSARGAAGKQTGPGHLAGGGWGDDTSRGWSGSLGTGKSRPFTPHLSWEGP